MRKSKTNQHRTLLFLIGLFISLSLVLTAFEWRFEPEMPLTTFACTEPPECLGVPPLPYPEYQLATPLPVSEEVEIEVEDYTALLGLELEEEIEVLDIPEEDIEIISCVEASVTPLFIVEKPATPPGGMRGFYMYVAKNINYPRLAYRKGTEGKVFLQFTIEKDGSVTDIEVLRGVGDGCSEEAVRVLSNSPKWAPAKQRGKIVRQRMTLPIRFEL